ncbi:hypothetical protein FC831_10490 [Clostridium botulinum]|nr:hypothetical protein [Clostridium botulinum]
MSEQIKVLTNKEQARTKINVWHGSSSNWINMIKELVGNSLDIFEKIRLNTGINKTQEIKIIIHNKNKIEYIDSATGIPVEGFANDGTPNYKAIFEIPFAGSNYDDDVATVGTNGIFIFSLAMTCEDIECFIARPNKNIYNLSYHKGDIVKDLNIIGNSEETYTKLIFSLDNDVWDNVNFTFEQIKSIVKGQASLSNVKITLVDLENDLQEEYEYTNGIEDYFDELNLNKNNISERTHLIRSHIVEVKKGMSDTVNCDMVFNFSNDSNDCIQKDFLNTADLIQHGTINDGIILGFKNSIHKWLKDNEKYDKKDKPITLEDVNSSLNYVCNIKSLKAKYVSQIKQQTLEPHYKTSLKIIIEEFMEIYFTENPISSGQICNQILINKRAREKSEISRSSVKKELEKGANSALNRPKKFTPCSSKDRLKKKVILTEGDSSKEPLEKSRDKATMALYALKGKIINCIKNDLDSILNNQEVRDIFKILGCGMEYKGKAIKGIKKYCEEDLEYNEIDIMCDFDWDGIGHIAPLVICVFYVLAPKIIENGHLYIMNTPLYEIEYKNKSYYAYSDEEKDAIIKENNIGNNRSVKRFKGLGSLSTQNLVDTAMSEDKYLKDKITIKDAEECYKSMMLCLSDEKKSDRKELLETRGNEFFDVNMLEV